MNFFFFLIRYPLLLTLCLCKSLLCLEAQLKIKATFSIFCKPKWPTPALRQDRWVIIQQLFTEHLLLASDCAGSRELDQPHPSPRRFQYTRAQTWLQTHRGELAIRQKVPCITFQWFVMGLESSGWVAALVLPWPLAGASEETLFLKVLNLEQRPYLPLSAILRGNGHICSGARSQEHRPGVEAQVLR